MQWLYYNTDSIENDLLSLNDTKIEQLHQKIVDINPLNKNNKSNTHQIYNDNRNGSRRNNKRQKQQRNNNYEQQNMMNMENDEA